MSDGNCLGGRNKLCPNRLFSIAWRRIFWKVVNEESSLGFVALAFALAVGGGALGAILGTSHKRLCALISVGAGSLLGVTLFGILPETVGDLNWWELVLALISGYAVFSLVSKYIFHVCPACAAISMATAMGRRTTPRDWSIQPG